MAQDLDLDLSDFPVSVVGGSGGGAEEDDPVPVHVIDQSTGSNHHNNNRFVVQDLHAGGHIGHVNADEDDDDLMDMGNEESGFGNNDQGNLMDEDGEDEAMQFETVANKMFLSETEVVPLPTVHQNTGTSSDGSSSFTTNNSNHLTPGKSAFSTCDVQNQTHEILTSHKCTGKITTIAGTSAFPNLLTSKSHTITAKVSNNSSNHNTIILPPGQSITSAAELSNFINAIRPPSIPGTPVPQQQQPQKHTQIILQKGTSVAATTTTTAATAAKKQTTPASGSGGIQLLNASSQASGNNLTGYKVIMTTGGQQILLNATDLCNLQTVVKNSNSAGKSESQPAGNQQKAILTTGSGGQQIVLLSPMKSGTAQPVKVATASPSSATAQLPFSGIGSFDGICKHSDRFYFLLLDHQPRH